MYVKDTDIGVENWNLALHRSKKTFKIRIL